MTLSLPYVDLGRHAQHRGVDWPLVGHHLLALARVTGLVGLWRGIRFLARLVRRHLFGIVVVLVALAFTAGVVLGFLLMRWHMEAILSGLIGLLGISIGITYHSIGDTR